MDSRYDVSTYETAGPLGDADEREYLNKDGLSVKYDVGGKAWHKTTIRNKEEDMKTEKPDSIIL